MAWEDDKAEAEFNSYIQSEEIEEAKKEALKEILEELLEKIKIESENYTIKGDLANMDSFIRNKLNTLD